MTARADSLRSEVLALPDAERAGLAIELLDSFDDRPAEAEQGELNRIWADESARRALQIDSGEVVTDSWDDVIATLVAIGDGVRFHPLAAAEVVESQLWYDDLVPYGDDSGGHGGHDPIVAISDPDDLGVRRPVPLSKFAGVHNVVAQRGQAAREPGR